MNGSYRFRQLPASIVDRFMTRTFPSPLSVLMPVCNERDVIETVVEEWHREVLQFLPAGSEFILDDGASTDGTLEILEALQRKYPYIRILYSKRDGFAASAKRLYTEARCPVVFFTDSDGQYIATEFWKLAPHIDHADMVHGAKMIRRDPFPRLILSDVFNFIARRKFGTKLGDINSAFRLVRKTLLDQIVPSLHCQPTLINAELLLRAHCLGYHILQVDIAHRDREHGTSRGLPTTRMIQNCWQAYRGLCSLQAEVGHLAFQQRAAKVVGPVKEASSTTV